jgi:hypothetical protein
VNLSFVGMGCPYNQGSNVIYFLLFAIKPDKIFGVICFNAKALLRFLFVRRWVRTEYPKATYNSSL